MTDANDDESLSLSRRTVIKGTAASAGAVGLGTVPSLGAAQQADSDRMGFRVRIENVSTPNTLDTPEGSVAVPLSPGAYAVHDPAVSLFEVGQTASPGIEDIAEDGVPTELVGALAGAEGVNDAGAFAGPQTAEDPNQPENGPQPPIFPGGAYEFVVSGTPGDRFSFATMFIQSNDLFYAPSSEGIALFEGGEPVEGDVTDQIGLWDAGTEIDQQPGTGADQAPRQSGRDTGAPDDDSSTVQPIDQVNAEGYDYPATEDVIEVTIETVEPTPFRVRIENVSTPSTLDTPNGSVPVPLSPGAYAVHDPTVQMFATGQPALPGLEDIAEDGVPTQLVGTLSGSSRVREAGAFAGGQTLRDPNQPANGPKPPIFPGGAYEFVVHALPGDRFSFATMFIQSNDLFYAPAPEGLPMFEDGEPVEGDVTDQIGLWDAGTEIDQQPGTGADQAPRQSGRDTGAPDDDSSTVQPIDQVNAEGYDYPATEDVIRVTVEADTDFSPTEYTNSQGTVDRSGFQAAVQDWARGRISTDQLQTIISRWVVGQS